MKITVKSGVLGAYFSAGGEPAQGSVPMKKPERTA